MNVPVYAQQASKSSSHDVFAYYVPLYDLTHSKSGTIDRTEFYKSVDEKNSEFGDAIFTLIGAYISNVRGQN